MPPRKRTLPPIEEGLIPHPMAGRLPDAETLRSLNLPFSEDEMRSIRIAMLLWSDSRKPKLAWAGWQHIGFALELGKQHADRAKQPKKAMSLFLNATSFAFINEGLRWALRKCINQLADINEWYKDLTPSRRSTLNDPINVWEQYNADQSAEAKPAMPKRKGGFRRQHRDFPTLLEEYQALSDKLELVEEQRDELRTLLGEIRDTVKQRKDDPDFAEIYEKIVR